MTREEAKEILQGSRITSFRPNGTARVKEALDMAIESLQSADRPQGQWEYCKHEGISDIWKCNQCGAWMFGKTNYCPNCGADMK